MPTSSLKILATAIRQDADGRYCLNDCHRASGSEKSKQPANFLRLDTTQALVTEIFHSSDMRTDPVSVSNGGKSPGTYVAKELVYAYAMWISPEFSLTVIRAFDALVNTQASKVAPQTFQPFDPSNAIAFGLSFFPNLGESAKQAFVAHTFEAALGRAVLPAPVVHENLLSATQVGQRLGLSANMVGRLANTYGLKDSRYGEFRLTTTRGGGKHVEQFHYNEKGVAMLEKVK